MAGVLVTTLPALAARPGNRARPAAAAKATDRTPPHVGESNLTAAFEHDSPLGQLQANGFASTQRLVKAFEQGLTSSVAMAPLRTGRIDKVDLDGRMRAYQAALSDSAEALTDAHARQALFDRYFYDVKHQVPNERAYFALQHGGARLDDYAVRGQGPAVARPDRRHEAVAELMRIADRDPAAARMLTAALEDPLTMALVIHAGLHAESSGAYDPHSVALRTVAGGLVAIEAAEKAHEESQRGELDIPPRLVLSELHRDLRRSVLPARAEQIRALPRARIQAALGGVLTRQDVTRAIPGLEL